MRISTSTIYERGVSAIQRQQADLLQTQQQIATGRRILSPADDPVAAARALEVSQSQAINEQYGTNTNNAKSSLGLEESILTSVTSLVQDVRVIAVQVGNPALDNSNRASLATELRGRYAELLGLANSTDSNGQYLFSGYKGSTQPFTQTAPGTVAYNGDQGQRLIQISPSRQIAISDPGSDIFQRIKTGNGTFTASPAGSNSGTSVIGAGSVVTGYTGNNYQIQFSVAAGVTSYAVVNTTTSTTLSTGNAYTSGNAIAFAGIQVNLQGVPSAGDTFDVAPSTNQDIFKTLDNLITQLETPISSPSGSAKLNNSANAALLNLDHTLDTVLKVRASVGAQLKEIDSAKNTGDDLGLQYQQTLSTLQDVDYNKAVSDLKQSAMFLEAAQQSFLKVSKLSLFNFL